MEPDNQIQSEENEALIQMRDLELAKAAMKKCQIACNTRDLNQIKQYIPLLWDERYVQIVLGKTATGGWLEATQFIIEQGADPNKIALLTLGRKCRSMAMFHLLAKFGMDFKSKQGNILPYVVDSREILDWLLDQGLDINRGGNASRQGARGRVYRDNTVAVLNETAKYGDIELFDYLVARGASPSKSNALHYAALCKDQAKVVAMITHLVDTYHLDVDGNEECGGLNELIKGDSLLYPLDYAVSPLGTIPAAEILLRKGAKIGDAWATAIKYKQAPALKLLLDAGADASKALVYTLDQDDLEGAKICIKYGGDIARAELRDKERTDDTTFIYNGMSDEMRKLLDEYKSRNKENIEI